ncbi:TIGR03943 family putative permease subunit [Bacillus suaedaesalsae]|uniref:TIGR03943 family protein n=1 Tax=Bacillus suaedaesalsae TaxID=2810349 RepID=A0ABS2DKC9_9BACI|nr:TIGR03943 family protein [Bacillus suaedaesalsae]MBM6618962.1 TIGR03943 family protein [Bacillus suaedaesalsae]
MQFHFQQAVRALILLAFSALLFNMHFTGEITKFINPKYEALSQIASILFLILFFIQVTRIWTAKVEGHHHDCQHHDHTCTHDHGDSKFNVKKLVSYCVIITPLLTGFFLPPKTLDAAVASKKGGMAILSNQQQKKETVEQKQDVTQEDTSSSIDSLEDESFLESPLLENQKTISQEEYDQLISKLEDSQTIKMDDFVYNAYYEEMHKDISKYEGRKIELNGFVYKEEGFTPEQLVISRFIITHCVADASIIGFLSEFPEASSLDVDTWIKAEGVIELTTYNDMELPIIKITKWEKITEPEEPYIYPLSIKLL